MRIENESKFLVLHSDAGEEPARLEIVESFSDVLLRWTPGTRLSPIWPLAGYGLGLSPQFAEPQKIIFLGPVRPSLIADQLIALREPGAAEIWLSAGCFNVVARAPFVTGEVSRIDDLASWAKAAKIPHETWKINAGKIESTESWINDVSISIPHLFKLAELSNTLLDQGLRATFQEFLTLQASTLTRSAAIVPDLFEDFAAVWSDPLE
jgi:hypothetical protein